MRGTLTAGEVYPIHYLFAAGFAIYRVESQKREKSTCKVTSRLDSKSGPFVAMYALLRTFSPDKYTLWQYNPALRLRGFLQHR